MRDPTNANNEFAAFTMDGSNRICQDGSDGGALFRLLPPCSLSTSTSSCKGKQEIY